MAGTPALVEELSALLARIAAADPHDFSDPALIVGLDGLLRAETTLRAVQTRWLAVADTREAPIAICGRATRSWLIEEFQLAPKEAGARVKLARTLGGFPLVEAAFRDGDLTAEQTSVIVAALLDVPVHVRDVVARELLRLAESLPPFALARAVDAILATLGVDQDQAEERRERRRARRHVDVDATFDGTGHLSGSLTPEVYEALRLAIDAAGANLTDPEDDRTVGQRRHDALGDVANFYLANADLPAVNGERPRVTLTLSRHSLLGGALDTLGDDRWATHQNAPGPRADGWAVLDSGVPVPPETVQRLACDSQILPVTMDGNGDVLALGRTTRVFSMAIRRAAWIHDEGRCTFPRCRRRPAELHHIIWGSRGGTSDLDNAAWLCTFHHWLVHEAGWSLRRSAAFRYVFTAPDGREFRHPPRQPEAA